MACAQTLGQAADPPISYWRVTAAFAICVVLAVTAALAMRSRLKAKGIGAVRLADAFSQMLWPGKDGSSRRLTVIESVRVSPQLEVCLLNCDGYVFLVASSGQTPVLLDKREAVDREPNS